MRLDKEGGTLPTPGPTPHPGLHNNSLLLWILLWQVCYVIAPLTDFFFFFFFLRDFIFKKTLFEKLQYLKQADLTDCQSELKAVYIG